MSNPGGEKADAKRARVDAMAGSDESCVASCPKRDGMPGEFELEKPKMSLSG